MKSPNQIKPPENWQDFEALCKKLWGEIWNCSDTIKRNGRNGQKQCGVDIYGIPKNELDYYGIQCKGKDRYTNAQLTKNEIDSEISKAMSFKPTLKGFYFASTAAKDVYIEEYIRIKDIDSRINGNFAINVFFWEDIVDLLKENRNTYNWYVNDCLYLDNTDAAIFFENKCHQIIITPTYYAVSKQCQGIVDKLSKHNTIGCSPYSFTVTFPKNMRDESWCKVSIIVENIGSSTIDGYIVCLNFSSDGDFDIDDDLGVKAHTGMMSMMRSVHTPIEVLANESDKYIEFRPILNRLIQNDRQSFSFWIHTLSNVKVDWEIKAVNYSKKGELGINCSPRVEKKYKQDNITDIPFEQLIIEPKIIDLD